MLEKILRIPNRMWHLSFYEMEQGFSKNLSILYSSYLDVYVGSWGQEGRWRTYFYIVLAPFWLSRGSTLK